MIFVFGDQVIGMNPITGSIQFNLHRKGSVIRAIACKDHYLAIACEDKELQLWDIAKLEQITSLKTMKKATKLIYTPDGLHLLLSDKMGDLYKFAVTNIIEKPTALLGHLSILTDFALSSDKKYIITVERDEKIRMTHYPATYDIFQFCLGHTEYVSCLAVLGESGLFVSGGGDEVLLIWQSETGDLVQTINLRDVGITFSDAKINVMAIAYHSSSNLVAVLFEEYF